MKNYDLVIVGAGPSGMSASLFAAGDGLNFRLIENKKSCGFPEEVINTNFTNLENYLGFYNLNGTEVSQTFREHLNARDIKIYSEDILEIENKEELLRIKTNKENYKTKTLILATGTKPRKLQIKGIEKVLNRVHYGINSKLSDYSGKEVLVVGGRNSGAVTGVRLKQMGCFPTIIERGDFKNKKFYL